MRSDDSILWLMAPQEEMAAASLDVNFKEELSAIEQCEYSVLRVHRNIKCTIRKIHLKSFFALRDDAEVSPLFLCFL